MIKNITFFDSVDELENITGLTHDELWENGFNLDDMEWGFVTEGLEMNVSIDEFGFKYYDVKDYHKGGWYIHNLLTWMEQYCVGYTYTEYKGKQFFTLHHS